MFRTSSDRLVELQQRETEIGALRSHPAFQRLRAELAEQEDTFWQQYLRDIRKNRARDPYDIDVKREAFRLAKEILDEPDEIERKLQKELRKHAERSPS